MPSVSDNIAHVQMLGYEGLNDVLAKFITAIFEALTRHMNRKQTAILKDIGTRSMDFNERMDALQNTLDTLHDYDLDDSIAKILMSGELNETVNRELHAAKDDDSMTQKEQLDHLNRAAALCKDNTAAADIIRKAGQDSVSRFQQIKQQFHDIKEQGFLVQQGIKEVYSTIAACGLKEEEKRQLRKALKNSERQMHDVYAVQFSPDAYFKAKAKMVDYGITKDPTTRMFQTGDGSLVVLVDGRLKDRMNLIARVCAWELGEIKNPTRELLEAETLAAAQVKGKAAEYVMELKPDSEKTDDEKTADGKFYAAVLRKAQRIYEQSYGNGNTAVEYDYDAKGNPMGGRILVGVTGNSNNAAREEKETYKQLVLAITQAQMELHGPGGDKEADRMLHIINTDRKLDKAIDDAAEGKENSGGAVVYLHGTGEDTRADSYIEFDTHSYTPVFNGREGLPVQNSGNNFAYRQALREMVRCNDGETVFISKDVLDAQKANGIKAQKDLNNEIGKELLEFRNDPEAYLRAANNSIAKTWNELNKTDLEITNPYDKLLYQYRIQNRELAWQKSHIKGRDQASVENIKNINARICDTRAKIAALRQTTVCQMSYDNMINQKYLEKDADHQYVYYSRGGDPIKESDRKQWRAEINLNNDRINDACRNPQKIELIDRNDMERAMIGSYAETQRFRFRMTPQQQAEQVAFAHFLAAEFNVNNRETRDAERSGMTGAFTMTGNIKRNRMGQKMHVNGYDVTRSASAISINQYMNYLQEQVASAADPNIKQDYARRLEEAQTYLSGYDEETIQKAISGSMDDLTIRMDSLMYELDVPETPITEKMAVQAERIKQQLDETKEQESNPYRTEERTVSGQERTGREQEKTI